MYIYISNKFYDYGCKANLIREITMPAPMIYIVIILMAIFGWCTLISVSGCWKSFYFFTCCGKTLKGTIRTAGVFYVYFPMEFRVKISHAERRQVKLFWVKFQSWHVVFKWVHEWHVSSFHMI